MANWRQKVVDWDHENADWGGEKQLQKSIKDAQSNIHYLKLYGKGGCILDVGSNIGEFAIEASHLFDEVFCYEAHPMSYKISLSRTSKFKNIMIENKAVWKSNGEHLFVSTPENSTGATAREKKFYSSRKEGYYKIADSVSFDELMMTKNPRVIKIDIEGCEYEILPSAEFNGALEFISVEFHQPFVSPSRIKKFNQCLTNLKNNGFSIVNDVNLKPRKLLYFIIIFQRKKII